MSWSYSGNPANSTSDEVRFLVGDTDSTDPQLSDEEIAYQAAKWPSNPYIAAALCAENISAKWAKKANRTVGSLSVQYQEKYQNYKDLAADLRIRSKSAFVPGAMGLPQLTSTGTTTYLGPDDTPETYRDDLAGS